MSDIFIVFRNRHEEDDVDFEGGESGQKWRKGIILVASLLFVSTLAASVTTT